MRLLQIIDVYKTGGAEKVYDLFYSWAIKNKFKIYRLVYFKSEYNQELDYLLNTTSPSIIKKIIEQKKGIKELRKYIQKNQITNIISFLDRSNIISILAAKSIKNINKITVTIHNPPTVQYQKLNKIIRHLVFVILRHYYNLPKVHVVAVSQKVADSLRIIGVKKVNIVLNPAKEIDENLVLKYEKPYFLFIGRLEYQKACWKLIKSFYLFNKKNPEYQLYLLGTGVDEDKIKNLVRELNLQSNVIIQGYKQNPLPYISNCEALVFSSIYEGFPITMLEAMQLKKVFIASKDALPCELLELFEKKNINLYYENNDYNENYNSNTFNEDEKNLSELYEKCLSINKEEVGNELNKWCIINCSIDNFWKYIND